MWLSNQTFFVNMPITFHNPSKSCFLNKNYNLNTHDTIFSYWIWLCCTTITISFETSLVYNNLLKVANPPPPHSSELLNSLLFAYCYLSSVHTWKWDKYTVDENIIGAPKMCNNYDAFEYFFSFSIFWSQYWTFLYCYLESYRSQSLLLDFCYNCFASFL